MPPSQEPQSTGWSIYTEQDSILSPKTDKDYTMGMQFNFSGWRVRQSALIGTGLGAPLRGLDKVVWFVSGQHGRACDPSSASTGNAVAPLCQKEGNQRGYQAHSFSFGVTAFTPRKGDPSEDGPSCLHHGCVLADTDPVYDDRPYSSLAYLTYRRSSAIGKTAVHSDFTVGMLGLQIAKVVQTAIHDDVTDPGGWRHQISNRGEPTANYSFTFKRLALTRFRHSQQAEPDWAGSDPNDPMDDRVLDLTLDGGASLGLYTNALAGGRIRVGRIDSPYWIQSRFPVVFTRRPRRLAELLKVREAYAWGSLGYTYWLHNSLLRGQFKQSTVTLHFDPQPTDPNIASPLNHGIWDFQAGFTIRLRPVAFSYQYTRHKNLFDGPHHRDHAYWGIYVSFSNPDLTP